MKKASREQRTSVFRCLEKFAPDAAELASNRLPDVTVESIADSLEYDLPGLLAGQRSTPSTTEATR
jgi:hypothetical protein